MNINVESIIQKVTDTLKTQTVIGERITVGEVTLIPVVNVAFGFGGGGGEGRPGNGDQGAGSGGGGGARMTVAGVIVVKGGDVSFLPTSKHAGKGGAIDKLLDALPGLIEKLSEKGSKKGGSVEDDN